MVNMAMVNIDMAAGTTGITITTDMDITAGRAIVAVGAAARRPGIVTVRWADWRWCTAFTR